MDDEIEPLCCCEYYDRTNERNHILTCCCNCVDLDEFVESLCCRRRYSPSHSRNMVLTMQDRLRMPWCGGAKQITSDILAPIVILVLCHLFAAINMYCTIIVFILMPVVLILARNRAVAKMARTKFFVFWLVWSVAYLLVVFEFMVPLLELLPEENLIFILLLLAAGFCFVKTYQKSQMNLIGMNRLNRDDDITEMGASTTVLLSEKEDSADDADDKCAVCRQSVPGRTTHCQYCNLCVIRQDHHSLWVNCCIGRFNHKFYIFGCFFAILASLLFANLTMTSVCHPFPLVQILSVLVLLPDDCSDVYHQYDIALCFVASIYALMLAVGIFLNLIQQLFLVSRGVTMIEWRRGEKGNRRNCFGNCRTFFCN